MQDLKLQALDGDDLKMLSAHCQDAVVRIDEMVYQSAAKRFALVCNRFDWANATRKSGWFQPKTFERRRAGLRFEHVLGVKVHGFNPNAGAVSAAPALSLLAIRYQPTAPDNPAGHITLSFGGGAAVRLDVGAIEAELRDLGGVWSTETKPDHDSPTPPTNSGRAEGRKS